MTDIFHEIEEDLRRERLRKLWDKYGIVVIALLTLLVAGTAAWSGYKYWRQQQAVAASTALADAVAQAEAGRPAEAEAALNALAGAAPAGYRTIARFKAATLAAGRDPQAGVAAFDTLAADPSVDPAARDVARLRAGLLLVDTAPLAAVAQRVDAVADGGGALRNSAREILALAQLKAGDAAAAYKSATAITEDAEAPNGVRSRAELIRRLTQPAAPAAGGAATQ